jgi:hypothetical protein
MLLPIEKGNVMKKLLGQIFCLIVLVCGSSGASGNDSLEGINIYPREVRLHPMLLPKKMWQVSNAVDVYYFGQGMRGFKFRPALLNFAPRRRVSPRIELPRFPYFPYVKILISEYDIGNRPDGTFNRFAMVFAGGVTGASYSKSDGTLVNLSMAVGSKLILNGRWWHGQSLYVKSVQSLKLNYNSLGLTEMLGYQITEKVAVTAGIDGAISPNLSRSDDFIIMGNYIMHLLLSLSRRFSLDVAGALFGSKILDGSKPYFMGYFSPRLTIQW